MRWFFRSFRCNFLLAAAIAVLAISMTGCDDATRPADAVSVAQTSSYAGEYSTLHGETPTVTIGYRTLPVRVTALTSNFAITGGRVNGSVFVTLRTLVVYMDGETVTLAAMAFVTSSDLQWERWVSDGIVRRLQSGAAKNSLAEQMTVVRRYLEGLTASAFPDVPAVDYVYLVPPTVILSPQDWGPNTGALVDWMMYPYR